MKNLKNFNNLNIDKTKSVKQQSIISETHRSDGTLATRLIKTEEGTFLFQYDKNGNVSFSEKLTERYSLKPADITYNNGTVATITRYNIITGTKTINQYDETGHVITSIELNNDDIVNFSPSGRILSIVKHIRKYANIKTQEIEELQFNESGRITSSVHKVKMTELLNPGTDKWLITETKQYHNNGTIASVITYKQKTNRRGDILSSNHTDEAASYVSSITTFNETGNITTAVQLGEFDEVSFNNNKVACIVRRQPDGKHDIISQTTYYSNGQICTITQYQDNKVISTITYDENGSPITSAQEGNERYQNIFLQTQKSIKNVQQKGYAHVK